MKIVIFLCTLLVSATLADRFKKAYNRTYEGFEKDQNADWLGDFTFIQSTDPQFGLTYAAESNFSNQGNYWDGERQQLRQAIAEWNRLSPAPKFIVITGDLVNSFPSKNATLRRLQLDDLRSELDTINANIPLILLSGNHDIEDSPIESAVQQYVQEFGDDYFSFAYGGVLFIVLNSQYYKDHVNVGELYAQQNEWLDRQLVDAEAKNYTHAIVFQHIPWFFDNVDEPVHDVFTIPLSERKPIVEKLYNASIRHIFAGHYHRNAVGKYVDLEMVTTSAIGWQNDIDGPPNAKHGYRVVRVTKDRVNHEYVDIQQQQNGAFPTIATRVWVFVTLALLSVSAYLVPTF